MIAAASKLARLALSCRSMSWDHVVSAASHTPRWTWPDPTSLMTPEHRAFPRSAMGRAAVGIALVWVLASCAPSPPRIDVSDALLAVTNADEAAMYLTISNRGDESDQLVDAAVDGAAMVHVHRTEIDEDGVATMSTSGPLVVPGGDVVRLESGGLHFMVSGLPSLEVGDSVDASLRFEVSGTLRIEARVVGPADVPVVGGSR